MPAAWRNGSAIGVVASLALLAHVIRLVEVQGLTRRPRGVSMPSDLEGKVSGSGPPTADVPDRANGNQGIAFPGSQQRCQRFDDLQDARPQVGAQCK
jgi:hypothetical protein